MTNNPIETVLKADLCAGCGLCSSVTSKKIKIAYTQMGFPRPEMVDRLSTYEASLIGAVCPGLILKQTNTSNSYHTIWDRLFN
jgi:coenzyme F420 hydrogenase subunit beta